MAKAVCEEVPVLQDGAVDILEKDEVAVLMVRVWVAEMLTLVEDGQDLGPQDIDSGVLSALQAVQQRGNDS